MSLREVVEEWQAYDRSRPSAPGEHLAVAGLGAALLLAAMRSDSRFGAVLTAAAGGAFLFRAASGRDGLVKLLGEPATYIAARRDAEYFGLD